MDIDLLAKMVKEVIMDHDSVTLPGVGSFVTEVVPASFADKGYTIHPPYRRLFFSPKQGNDTLLADLYASSNHISSADATRILTEFLSEMKEVLKVRKTIIFPSLGRLRATRENHFFFIADEDLDIYPSGFGLEPVSLKTHEETREEVEEAVSSLAGMLEAPATVDQGAEDASVVAENIADAPQEASPASIVTENIADAPQEASPAPEDTEELPELVTVVDTLEEEITEANTAEDVSIVAKEIADAPQETSSAAPEPELEPEPEPEPESEPEPEPAPAPKPVTEYILDPELDVPPPEKDYAWVRVILRVLLWIAVLAVAALIVLAIVGRVAPDWLDRFLYSPEELKILHN